MSRYICTFYTVRDKSKVNKKNKVVKVIETSVSISGVIPILKTEHKAKFIKRIRNLDNNVSINPDQDLDKIEYHNNLLGED